MVVINSAMIMTYYEIGTIINERKVWGKFQRCPFNVGKPFFRWGYVILSQNKSDLVVF